MHKREQYYLTPLALVGETAQQMPHWIAAGVAQGAGLTPVRTSDGKQVLAELRKERPAKLRLILVLTGDLVSSHEDELKEMGVDAVCPKPVDIPCLLAILAAAGVNFRADTTEPAR